MEDLYSWLISLNFLRFNAYYETFAVSFGRVDLPLYGYDNEKKKKFLFDIENKTQNVEFRHRRVNKHKTIKVVLKNKSEIDINVKVYDKYLIAKKLIKSCLLYFLGAIQLGIAKNADNNINNQLLFNNLNNIDNNDLEDEIKIPRHLSFFYNIARIKSSEKGDTNTFLSQIVAKNQRKKSLALINEDEEEAQKDLINNEVSENDDDISSLKDHEKLNYLKKNKKKIEIGESSEIQSEKGSEKFTIKTTERMSDNKSEGEMNKKGKKKKKESNAINNDEEIYITDEENDIDDEDSLSEKNQKLKNTCDFTCNFSYMKNNKFNFHEEDEKIDIKSNSKLISSFNDSQDNFDIISKDKDLDSDETKIPNYFIKERNIRDFINKSQQNTMSIDFRSNYY